MTAALLGWGGFTWKRAEDAFLQARMAADAVDRLELKLAEKYLTKEDFNATMERLFGVIERIEEKIDYHVYEQDKKNGR